jgi:hypothetical protein
MKTLERRLNSLANGIAVANFRVSEKIQEQLITEDPVYDVCFLFDCNEIAHIFNCAVRVALGDHN